MISTEPQGRASELSNVTVVVKVVGSRGPAA
jgi:hypothetical protein